jgi:hypothetical protein
MVRQTTVAALLFAAITLGSAAARAQYPTTPAPDPVPPPGAYAPNGEFVAPLQQQTQPSYVPQSVAMSGPRIIKDWDDTQMIPHGYHRETRVRKGMVISGAIIFGVPYLYSALAGAVGSDASSVDGGSNKLAAMYVPVLGPFIEMGETSSATVRYMLALDGAAQAVGAFMVIYGLTSPRPVLVRNDLALLTVVPMHFGKDGAGAGFIGRF